MVINNLVLFGGSSALAVVLIDKVFEKISLNITVFTSKPNLIKKNQRVFVIKWNPSNPNLDVINKIQFKQSICCLFNALPKVNQVFLIFLNVINSLFFFWRLK